MPTSSKSDLFSVYLGKSEATNERNLRYSCTMDFAPRNIATSMKIIRDREIVNTAILC